MVYLRLLIFLLAILIPACDSSSPTFCMIYSSYKLNMRRSQYTALETLFSILNQSVVVPCPVLNCCFLTFIQVLGGRYSHIFKNFPQFVVIHIVRGLASSVKQK